MAENEGYNIKDKVKRSTVVGMISIFYLLVGFMTLLANSFQIVIYFVRNNASREGEPLSILLLIIVGITMGILMIIASVGLWKLKRWAYQMAIVISGLSVPIYLFVFITALGRGQSSTVYGAIVFHALILVGLFSRNAKVLFTSLDAKNEL